MRTERVRGPARARKLGERALLQALGDRSLDACWDRLRARPFLVPEITRVDLERVAPGEPERVLAAAARAEARELDLLGTGMLPLGRPADWHTDIRSGTTWPPAWWRTLDYAQLGRPSDVKVPWEISRLQWLLAGRPGIPARSRRAPRRGRAGDARGVDRRRTPTARASTGRPRWRRRSASSPSRGSSTRSAAASRGATRRSGSTSFGRSTSTATSSRGTSSSPT